MKKLLRKQDWNHKYHSPEFDKSTPVVVWKLDHGCLCTLRNVGGMVVIENGTYSAANTLLARLLAEAGITGDITIHTTALIPQNVSRWLTWWLSTEPEEDDPHLRTLTVSTMGQIPTKKLPFQVNVIKPATMAAYEVLDYVRQSSRNPSVSQFLVEHGEQVYRLEPERRTEAKIVDCTSRGYVLRTQSNHVFLTNMVSRRIQAQLKAKNLRPENLIGATVRVEYTMFTDGNRLCNYKSPIVYRCTDLDTLCPDAIPPYDGPFMFISNQPSNNALLTATRCGRARITQNGDSIIGCDGESELQLFRFTRGVEDGCYAATLERQGQSEDWRFESDLATDALDPDAFVRCVENHLYHTTGYRLQGIRLKYVDRTNTPTMT
ncbi:hypothetical protein FDI85_gp009 [Erwinia phage Machina]|uniref:Uncharacterized protein n=2 Tax=Machinavirus machina TaxID=2169990 RepID=A0A1B2IDJ7_9CAUD|nr:hypothetical protein BIZ81_gp009 [Erwinia phage vB_EamM_Huxley]YP_009617192.1 hypothetical protein FDI85_gp009 [Erwinia phage Machina]ANZ49356.1 hypothetical protein HUXLEY_274 [Erwinia phage vB_EamM_Huxley]ANZ49913.1 hypothetical protein MACHINA_275 [Erwinia phage Machina]